MEPLLTDILYNGHLPAMYNINCTNSLCHSHNTEEASLALQTILAAPNSNLTSELRTKWAGPVLNQQDWAKNGWGHLKTGWGRVRWCRRGGAGPGGATAPPPPPPPTFWTCLHLNERNRFLHSVCSATNVKQLNQIFCLCRLHQKLSQSMRTPKNFLGGMPPDPYNQKCPPPPLFMTLLHR